jgi:hypothetical protein
VTPTDQDTENMVQVYRCSNELEVGRAVAEVLRPEGIEGFVSDRTDRTLPTPATQAGAFFVSVSEKDAEKARQLLADALDDGALDIDSGDVIELDE